MFFTNCTKLRTYEEACHYDYWLKAMKTELDSLGANNTWQLVAKDYDQIEGLYFLTLFHLWKS